MIPFDGVLTLVRNHCDLEARLEAIPPRAAVRGLYFSNSQRAVEQAGLSPNLEALVGRHRYTALRLYPLHDYLVTLAAAGALLASPAGVHAGMVSASRGDAPAFAQSLLGRALLHLLASDPRRLLQQGVAARRQSANYGRWSVTFPAPRQAEMRFADEYIWIESAMAGAAHGTFGMIGMQVDIEVELTGPYDGVHRLRW